MINRLFIFLLYVLIIYYIYKYFFNVINYLFKQPSVKVVEQKQNQKKYIDTQMEKLGQDIKNTIVLDPSELKQKTLELVSNGSINPTIVNVQLNTKQQEYLDYLSNLIVGKYNLTHVEEILILNNVIKDILLDPSRDINTLDPRKSDILLLDICRGLMRVQSIPVMKKLLIGQWIANKTYDNKEIEIIYDFILKVSKDPNVSLKTRMNAVDILNQSNNSKYITSSKKSLDTIRAVEDNLPQNRVNTLNNQPVFNPFQVNIDEQRALLDNYQSLKNKKPVVEEVLKKHNPKAVYFDTQNVHETSINKSVINAAKKLVSNYKANKTIELPSLLDDLNPQQSSKINEAIHRIMTDSSNFNNGISLYDVYQSLLQKIESSPDKDELRKRLKEELIDMSGLCATGHLSRLMMVTQGFEDQDPSVKIDISKELYAKLKTHLDKSIQNSENAEELVDSLIGDKKLVKNFILKEEETLLPELIKQYQGIEDEDNIRKMYSNSLTMYLQ